MGSVAFPRAIVKIGPDDDFDEKNADFLGKSTQIYIRQSLRNPTSKPWRNYRAMANFSQGPERISAPSPLHGIYWTEGPLRGFAQVKELEVIRRKGNSAICPIAPVILAFRSMPGVPIAEKIV
jgi:hypothetical protein